MCLFRCALVERAFVSLRCVCVRESACVCERECV